MCSAILVVLALTQITPFYFPLLSSLSTVSINCFTYVPHEVLSWGGSLFTLLSSGFTLGLILKVKWFYSGHISLTIMHHLLHVDVYCLHLFFLMIILLASTLWRQVTINCTPCMQQTSHESFHMHGPLRVHVCMTLDRKFLTWGEPGNEAIKRAVSLSSQSRDFRVRNTWSHFRFSCSEIATKPYVMWLHVDDSCINQAYKGDLGETETTIFAVDV